MTHNSFEKVKTRQLWDSHICGKNCKTTVNILIKKISPDTIEKNETCHSKMLPPSIESYATLSRCLLLP